MFSSHRVQAQRPKVLEQAPCLAFLQERPRSQISAFCNINWEVAGSNDSVSRCFENCAIEAVSSACKVGSLFRLGNAFRLAAAFCHCQRKATRRPLVLRWGSNSRNGTGGPLLACRSGSGVWYPQRCSFLCCTAAVGCTPQPLTRGLSQGSPGSLLSIPVIIAAGLLYCLLMVPSRYAVTGTRG